MTSPELRAAIERSHQRLWMLCYRMTGKRHDADDLCQEALTRAIERAKRLAHCDHLDGWLVRIATTVCLDHLRHRRVERRVTELVDPLAIADLSPGSVFADGPEAATLLRDDVRFAVMVALQHLPVRQRAALILRDVYDQPLEWVAEVLGTNANAAKAILHRARATLAKVRRGSHVDVIVDRAVVERMARAIEMRSVAAFTALLADDVWGVIDGGGVVRTADKPTFGIRAVSRQWANANRRELLRIAAQVRIVNGEPTVLVTAPQAGHVVIASIHIETRRGTIAALRVIRDPQKLAYLGTACE